MVRRGTSLQDLIMNETTPASATDGKPRFPIKETLDLADWCARSPRPLAEECINIIPAEDGCSVVLYRAVGDGDSPKRLKTTLDNVDLTVHDGTADFWCLRGEDANTVLTFLTLLTMEQPDARVSITYYGDEGAEIAGRGDLSTEALYLSYRTTDGQHRQTAVKSTYRYAINTMAKTRLSTI